MWWVGLALAGDCAVVEGEQLAVSAPFAFEARSSDLSDDVAVREVLCWLEGDPERTVQIEVHTDSQGSGSYNLRMSQARADAVREAIRKLGVAEGRVTAVGYGETMPIASNATAEGRAANRRIELHLVPPSERPPSPQVEAPVPRPAPVAVEPKPRPKPPTLCEQIDQQIVIGEGFTWSFLPPAEPWVEEVRGCLSGWDVDGEAGSLYAHRAGWALTVELGGDQVVMELATGD